MLSSTRSGTPFRNSTCRAPPPSTLVSAPTRMVRDPVIPHPECRDVEGVKYPIHIVTGHPVTMQKRDQGGGVRSRRRAETAVTTAVMPGAQSITAGVGDRTQTGDTLGHGHARHPGPFALGAHRRRRQLGLATDEQRGQGVQQLATVDRAPRNS